MQSKTYDLSAGVGQTEPMSIYGDTALIKIVANASASGTVVLQDAIDKNIAGQWDNITDPADDTNISFTIDGSTATVYTKRLEGLASGTWIRGDVTAGTAGSITIYVQSETEGQSKL